MANGQFDQLFQTCVQQDGQAYRNARQEILTMGASVLPTLDARVESQDWKEQLVARILAGWIRHTSLYEQVGAIVDSRRPPVSDFRPILGTLSGAKKALILASSGDSIVPRLLEILLKTNEFSLPEEREVVYSSLNEFASENMVLPLVEALRRAKGYQEQAFALNVLGQTRDPRAYEVANSMLAISRNAVVRRSALASIASTGERRGTATMLAIIQNPTEDRSVRQEAIHSLGVLGDPSAGPVLASLLQEARGDLALAVVDSLRKLGDRTLVASLEDAERNHPEASIRRAAADARQSLIA